MFAIIERMLEAFINYPVKENIINAKIIKENAVNLIAFLPVSFIPWLEVFSTQFLEQLALQLALQLAPKSTPPSAPQSAH